MRTSYEFSFTRELSLVNRLPNKPTIKWTRDEFINFRGAFPEYVVHGHTPTFRRYSSDRGSPDVRENRCNLDTGAGDGETLSAGFFNDAEAKPFHTVSVT